MKLVGDPSHDLQRGRFVSILLCLFLFWLVLFLKTPDSFTRYFHQYSLALFFAILLLYYIAFRLPDHYGMVACLGLTMLFAALSLSYIWSSGFSDNFIISGLIPYKDAKNYFVGTQLLLNGFPMVDAGQATERPLFPGFLAGILWLTGQNLKISMAIMTQLVALGIYFASRQIRNSLGAAAASLFAALLYFYIQPMIGYTMSETLGFIAGCFGFALIWSAAHDKRWTDMAIGILILLIAVSARAGAFFIFPLLAVWAGWIFRGDKQFSTKAFGYALLGTVPGYFFVNPVYSRLLGIPPGSAFANFSYALYGQVRGGTGWHSAIEVLGTRDSSVVYREAWNFFLQHPASLLIGFAKSYRDFFLTGNGSIFSFGDFGLQNWLNSLVWVTTIVLLVTGLIRSVKEIRNPRSSLVLAGFIGIFLSIPFLPPIDGGSRFYAGAVPFFFVVPALGINGFHKAGWSDQAPSETRQTDAAVSRYVAIALIVMTLILPLLLFSLAHTPAISASACPAGQDPFYIEYHAGSYVDLVRRGSGSCGLIPEICQDEFEQNNVERSIDDFYQTVLQSMHSEETNLRMIPALNFVNGRFHYFQTSPDEFAGSPTSGAISGCAMEVLTKNQSIYQVKSWSPVEK